MKRLLAGSLWLALNMPNAALGQEPPDVSAVIVGSKVRIQAPTVAGGRLEGIVSQIDDQSLLVLQDNHPWRVPRKAITRLEVSTGRHGRALKGLLIGAAIGIAAFQVTVSDTNCQNAMTVCSTSRGQAVAFGLLGGGAWGAGIGALIKSDRWSRVPLDHVHVSLAPAGGRGVRVSASIAWQ